MTDENKKNESLKLVDTPIPPKKSLAVVTQSTWTKPGDQTVKSLQQVLDAGAEDYSDVELTDSQEQLLVKTLKKMAVGSAIFAPMKCAGGECPFAVDCPLVQMGPGVHGKAPVNKPCLLEETTFREALGGYVMEYEVDPASITELTMCSELAEIEVLQWRLNMTLRQPQHASLVTEQTVGVTPQGEQITQLQVSPIFEQKQKLANRKSKLIKLMVGDRQEKYKKEAALKQKTEADAASQMSDVKKQLQELQQNMKTKARQQIIDGEVIEAKVVTPNDIIDQTVQKDSEE